MLPDDDYCVHNKGVCADRLACAARGCQATPSRPGSDAKDLQVICRDFLARTEWVEQEGALRAKIEANDPDYHKQMLRWRVTARKYARATA